MNNKVLFVMCEGIGNMVMALPAINAIKRASYDVHVCGKYPALDLVPSDIPAWTLEQVEQAFPFDTVLLSPWSSEYQTQVGTVERHADATVFRAEAIDGTLHEAMIHFDLAAVLDGVEMPSNLSEIELPSIPTQETAIPEPPYIVLANTAAPTWEHKRWGGYPELANRLSDAGYQVVVVGTDADALYNFPEQYPDGTIYHYDLPLLKVNYLLERAEWVVGNDCGIVHIASALKTRTIAIFGPTSTDKNTPLGYFHKDPNTIIAKPQIPCAPCQFQAWESVCEKRECLEAITAERIYSVVMSEGKVEGTKYPLYNISQIHKSMKGDQKLAIVMRVKDAIDTIEECLTAAARIADVFCIVDNGSTDGTLEYLIDFNAKHSELFPKFRFEDMPYIQGLIPLGTFHIAQTIGYDQPRDRQVMDTMLKNSGATWGLFLDADEIISEQITREKVQAWMHQTDHNAVHFRHVHFWNDKHHYRIDQRWKPRHNRMMWRITPESTIQDDAKVHPGIVHNLKGRRLFTDDCIKHYGHIDKEKNAKRAEFYKSIDNPSLPNWTGRTYDHMTDETRLELAEWHEDTPIKERNFGRPSQLLVLLHGGGDMLMATPMIAKLKQETPDLELSILGLGKTKERDFKSRQFFENNPHVDHYYDSAIDHHPTWWDEQTWRAVDMPVIEKDIQRIEQLTRFDKVSIINLQHNRLGHKIDRFAEACGVELADDEKRMQIFPTETDRVDTKRGYLKMLTPEERSREFPYDAVPKDNTISIHRWCGHPPKSWDYAEYKELCEFLIEKGFRLILWDKGDPEPPIRGTKIINMQDYMVDHWTIGCSAVLMEMCALHIGADSLPMHLASAVGIPTLAIFEKTFVSVAAPLNDNAVIAATSASVFPVDFEFYHAYAHRIAMCGLDNVKAEHLYPILNKMGFIDDADYQGIPITEYELMGQTIEVAHTIETAEPTADVFENMDWKEVKVSKALQAYIVPDESVFMDVGANSGMHSMLIGDKVQRGYAIEARLDVYEVLKRNLTRVNPKVEAINITISDEVGTAKLNCSTRGTGVSHLSDIPNYLSIDVKTTTLDTLGYRSDIIKIDVEGAELSVLKGAEETLKTARAVVVEIHKIAEAPTITSFLTERGFKIRYITTPVEQLTHHIIATADGETMLPFPVNCLYDPAELLTVQLNCPDQLTNPDVLQVTTLKNRDTTYWFEIAGIQASRDGVYLYCLNEITFEVDGDLMFFADLEASVKNGEAPANIFLNFLYSETGQPIRYKGQVVYPFNAETLQVFLGKCSEKGYHINAEQTDFENVDIADPRNLPDPSVAVTRGRLVLESGAV